jgi:nucleoside-diphosphate-sugar epimerase
MTTPKKLFCFGYGYTCDYLGHELMQRGGWEVSGTTRDSEKRKALKDRDINAHLYDFDQPLVDPAYILEGTTHLLISTPPGDEGDPVFLSHAQDILKIPTIEWMGYLSTTGVYGDRQGEWVDENSEIRPSSKRGSRRARAEEQWYSLYQQFNLPVHFFRLAGIYGPGRSALDSIRAGVARRINKPGHAFSRIHVEDVVQVLIASIENPNPGAAYNISDDLAAPSHEVIQYACELIGRAAPPLIPFDEADMSPIALSFYKDNKRVKNDKIKNELSVQLKYSDYKEGLRACLEAEEYALSLFKIKNRLF